MPPKPPFDALPLRKDGPPGNAWGLFGDEDEGGMLNLLTADNTTRAAAREIIDGTRVSTDWPLNRLSVPCFGRPALQHTIHTKAHSAINDDSLSFNTQVSSQWDGFRHYGFQKEQRFFNGKTQADLSSSNVNGIQAWVQKGGIVGRGVLLDYAAWADANGTLIAAFEATSINISTLETIALHQGTELRGGDILLIRTGWVRAYNGLPAKEQQRLADMDDPPAIGIESSERTLRWLWDRSPAAVAGDQPSMEAWPCQDKRFWLHEWLLAGWGMPIGEMFDLEALSEECRKRQRWSFFFSSMPLNVPGGVASPPNGMAIF